MAPTVARALAEFITSVRYEDLPARAIDLTRLAVLDNLGVMCGAVAEPTSRFTQQVVRLTGGTPIARVLATDLKTAPPLAALVNGTMGHAMDYDDACIFGHSSVVLVPTILAIGEMQAVTGRDAILAYVTGFDVAARLRLVLDIGQHRGWHPTAVAGTFASATAAAQLLGLDEQKTAMALGIAASEAAGLAANAGTMTKPYHVGNANRNGIMAALLAREGMTASADVFESPTGFARAFGGDDVSVVHQVVNDLGNSFQLAERGLSIKRYASCYATHWAVDSLIDLMRQGRFAANDVESIDCLGRPKYLDVLPYHLPRTGLEAKFSMEYCLAATLVSGRLGVDDFVDESVRRPAIRAVLSRISLRSFDDWNQGRDEAARPDRLTIRLQDGRELARETLQLPGALDSPRDWDSGLDDKFRSSVDPLFGQAVSRLVTSRVLELETLEDVGRVLDALTLPASHPS